MSRDIETLFRSAIGGPRVGYGAVTVSGCNPWRMPVLSRFRPTILSGVYLSGRHFPVVELLPCTGSFEIIRLRATPDSEVLYLVFPFTIAYPRRASFCLSVRT